MVPVFSDEDVASVLDAAAAEFVFDRAVERERDDDIL